MRKAEVSPPPDTIVQVPLPKAQLSLIPETERALILLIGFHLNEVTLLLRLLLLSTGGEDFRDIRDHYQAAQTHSLLRLLIGSTSEFWKLFEKSTHKKIVQDAVTRQHNQRAAIALSVLEEYFCKERNEQDKFTSGILRVRNKLAFHSPNSNSLLTQLDTLPEGAEWCWYISSANTRCSFALSHHVAAELMLRLVSDEYNGKAENAATVFITFVGKVIEIANALTDLAHPVMLDILDKYVEPEHTRGQQVSPVPETDVLDDSVLRALMRVRNPTGRTAHKDIA